MQIMEFQNCVQDGTPEPHQKRWMFSNHARLITYVTGVWLLKLKVLTRSQARREETDHTPTAVPSVGWPPNVHQKPTIPQKPYIYVMIVWRSPTIPQKLIVIEDTGKIFTFVCRQKFSFITGKYKFYITIKSASILNWTLAHFASFSCGFHFSL